MSQFPDERAAELKELFFETALELLQSLNEETLTLEKKPGDLETVRTIRRIVHTLKGDSAAVGFHELSELAHELEDALALETTGTPTSLAEVAFAAADTFGAMLSCYRKGAKLPSAEPVRKMIRKLAQDPKSRKPRNPKGHAASAPEVDWTEYEKLATQGALKQGKHVYHITAQIDPDCAMPIAAQQLILKALAETGEVLGTRPEAGSAKNAMQFQLLVASDQTAEYLTAKCRIPTIISQVKIENIGTPAQKVAQKANSGEAGPKPPAAQVPAAQARANQALTTQAEEKLAAEPAEEIETILIPSSHERATVAKPGPAPAENLLRVDAERIDTVLNLVGELIIGKSMLQQALNEFAMHYPKEAMRGRFADAMAFQSRVLNDLQRSVMKVRMVPVEQLFRRFPRMVRDVAKQCGKQVELVLSGQDTALDKSLLDAIAEPLTHLVRNAIGHGIESAEERTRSGKPAQGTIRLDAYHQGNQVIVEISDDGRGIDVQKIKTRAIERGLLKREEASRLNEANILDLIFRPGFSTADEITEISGRGVGLDVVQSVLHRLKGTVHLVSRPGQGSTFRLQLPLTLAIIKALLFRVEQRLYAIPLNAVAEIARAHESDIHQVDNCEVLQLRNRVLPVARLGRPPEQRPDGRPEKVFVLVIATGERKIGLLVNALEGEEELVIKALDDQTAETDLVSGASILGNGHVVLILNLSAIVERFAKSRPDTVGGPSVGLLLSHSERARLAQNAAGGQP
ncbi:MAG TPA: chemotaxis protein CheA [Terriglobales bacterium]|nr:chemotaxis protein CheA [Terriglobales bacterium]